MFITATVQRSKVTPDDRRAVFVAAKARRPRDVMVEPNEAFIRHMLKNRMGWGHRDPAPEALKAAAREIAASLKSVGASDAPKAAAPAA